MNIPSVQLPEIYTEHNFVDSKFVEIKSDDLFDVKMQYPLLNLKNAFDRCLVREEVAEKLIVAAKLLPAGYKIRVLDAWRPFALQSELFEYYSDVIIKHFGIENLDEDEKNDFVKRFVSLPNDDRMIPPVHTTGGAVDVTIVDASGKELDMGTVFDEFMETAFTSYFEEHEVSQEVLENRRLLYTVMTEAGFINLPSEWWHYDYGDRFWAFYSNEPAMYSGVFNVEEVI